MVFLHGRLKIVVVRANNLINCDSQVLGKVLGAFKFDVSDPFVTLHLGVDLIGRTSTIENNLNPQWNQRFTLDVAHDVEHVEFQVKDRDQVGKPESLGTAMLPVGELLDGTEVEKTLPLIKGEGGVLVVRVQYTSVDRMPDNPDVPDCYYKPRAGCRVVLYQDALSHVPSEELTSSRPKRRSCFEDIAQAIEQAERFIYIAGWSVHPKMLLRPGISKETLGDMLKAKVKEKDRSVIVRLAVWDDMSSFKLGFIHHVGIMNNFDEECRAFFKHTGVKARLMSRKGNEDETKQSQYAAAVFTHHQKTVVLDAPPRQPGAKRSIVAFLGGLDLTMGRRDTPDHYLYKTLPDFHADDFYNCCLNTTPDRGPREPWHDIHCKVEGHSAQDVMGNFQERWLRQMDFRKFAQLYRIDPEDFYLGPEAATDVKDTVEWRVQILRSIDGNAAAMSQDVLYPRISTNHGTAVDTSIHKAYVHQIRRAKHFIYIENQYFLGASHQWDDPSEDCTNLIPIELAAKICNKIRAGERFAIYVVIPMFPEGDPMGATVQAILYLQRLTMHTMYKRIVATLKEVKSNDRPTDYLNFYCLGNRETLPNYGTLNKSNSTKSATNPMLEVKARRHMIYVHSKMMIVDDEYIIVGSANINQRSLAGTRDTEIAAGCYQPAHTATAHGLPAGDVRKFRLSLWQEHLGLSDNMFLDPASKECVRVVNGLSKANWLDYTDPEIVDLKGHLMPYPVEIGPDGNIEALPEFPYFPDTKASVLGSKPSLPFFVYC